MSEFQNIINKVENFLNDSTAKEKGKIASGAYFLNSDEIVCCAKDFGDSRYPYAFDGLTLWAHASGNIKIEESAFNIILGADNGAEPNLCFFYGDSRGDNFKPVSITGAARSYDDDAERYTVFTPGGVYYIAKDELLSAAVKMSIDENKNIFFEVYLKNNTQEKTRTYLSAYINCILSHSNYENIENKWYKSCNKDDKGYSISVTEVFDRNTRLKHYAYVKRNYSGEILSTTSATDYKGATTNQVCNSVSLRTGKFQKNLSYTEFSDNSIVGEILPVILNGGQEIVAQYILSVGDNLQAAKNKAMLDKKHTGIIGSLIPPMSFDGRFGEILGGQMTNFIKNVFRQTEFCSRAKNYAGSLIGIRDIFQQLEAALVWIPDYCKQKIIEAINFLGEDGRAPRQYSYPRGKNVLPIMDLREYIDQGVWIISTIYTYLSYTNDFSILDEKCGYYKYDNNKVAFSEKSDTVLEHLFKIIDYLIGNLDDKTECLKILYGDWNDAVDGLGKSANPDKKFGNGVSVMATLQLYRNLNEMVQILEKTNKHNDRISIYNEYKNKIRQGLEKFAVDKNEKGERKIIHGWGEDLSHKVASFLDCDNKNRYGLTSGSFWVLCGALKWDESLKKDILNSFDILEGKYGLKTFEPYFGKDNDKVGRITDLPKGTAENGATYIHATLFAIQALFEMGEAERAWQQIYKILPITHSFISTTPFVMPNSYIHNEEKNLDGESMSDWFTGSGCVLIKTLIGNVFGIKPNLESLEIMPAKFLPFSSASLQVCIKGGKFNIKYENRNSKSRKIFINGESDGTESITFNNSRISGKSFDILIVD